jgi:hypothetical protein
VPLAGGTVFQMDQAASEDQTILRLETQIWIAVSVYVLVAIVKKRLGLEASLYTLLQIFSVTLLEKMPMSQAFFRNRTTSDPEEVAKLFAH